MIDTNKKNREEIALSFVEDFKPEGMIKTIYNNTKQTEGVAKAVLGLLSQYIDTEEKHVRDFITIHAIQKELEEFRENEGLKRFIL